MNLSALREKARVFRELHTSSGIFVMPCAWDAGSARLLQSFGFTALGTTSGGVNWGAARADYVYATPRETMLEAYGAITSAVSIPVSGDLENGYGGRPEDVAATIRLSIEHGMVGGSIEDQSSDAKPGLLDKTHAAERVCAAREAADASGIEYTLTARAESYFGNVADPFSDAVERANCYRDAGADCIFVPGPSDLDTIQAVAGAVDAPLSVGIGSGGGDLDLVSLRDAGVRRVSTGGGLPRALYALIEEASREILQQGTFGYSTRALTEDHLNTLFSDNA